MKIQIEPIQREKTEMADIDERYKTKKKEIRIKRARNAFKKNVPERLRKEWGERMKFFRSL